VLEPSNSLLGTESSRVRGREFELAGSAVVVEIIEEAGSGSSCSLEFQRA
jgi:hypothetical protein